MYENVEEILVNTKVIVLTMKILVIYRTAVLLVVIVSVALL